MLPKKLFIEISAGKVKDISPSATTSINIDGELIEFPDLFILPSFIESHAHLIGHGERLILPDISTVESFEALIEQARSLNMRKGQWIFLRGWNDTLWHKTPERPIDTLDALFPDIPVCFVRVDGHAMMINSAAVTESGIDISKPVDGGHFGLDQNGAFTGNVIDNAMQAVYDKIPEYSEEELIRIINISIHDYFSKGVTEIHDMDVYLRYIPIYQKLAKEGNLPLQIRSYIRAFDGEYKKLYPRPFQVGNLNICGLKFYADGALGSRGALLIEEYADCPGEKGLQLIDTDVLLAEAREGCKEGWEIAVHAIGDKAVRNVLDVFEKLREEGYKNIFRIEHSQIVAPLDLIRYKKLSVIPSVQSIHCTSDSSMASERLGQNMSYAYPWCSFLEKDIEIIAGSDAPIETNSVIEGINAFVHREPKNKASFWNFAERISIEDALIAYSQSPLYGRSRKKLKTIEDIITLTNSFIIVDNNFADYTSASILGTNIIATVSNGSLVYSPNQSTIT